MLFVAWDADNARTSQGVDYEAVGRRLGTTLTSQELTEKE